MQIGKKDAGLYPNLERFMKTIALGMVEFEYGDWFELLAIGKNNDVWFPMVELKPIIL